MTLTIKNMVCQRCKLVVEDIADSLALPVKSIELGSIEFNQDLSQAQFEKFQSMLTATGLEILDNKNVKLLEQIKANCIHYLEQQFFLKDIKLSDYLSSSINRDYSHISRLFTSIESVSIEQYYLALRIEKVKELISYQQLSFAEIAFDLGYSSVAHLSRQFKKITGLTLSEFRANNKHIHRHTLDNIKVVQ